MAKYAGEAGGSDRYELEMVSLFPCCSVKPDRKKNKLVGYVFVFDNLEFKRTIRGKILLWAPCQWLLPLYRGFKIGSLVERFNYVFQVVS